MASGIDWFRWHHGSVTDPKFQLVAKKSGASVAEVIAVWAFMLEESSMAEERGNHGMLDFDSIDCALGLDDGKAHAIYSNMEVRGLIEDGRVLSWEKRQPKRERTDDNSSVRVKAFREKQRHVTPNADDETPCNANENQETPREEKSREEKEQKTGATRFDFLKALIENGVVPSVAADYMAARKAKKCVSTETAFGQIAKEAEKAGLSIADAVLVCCKRGWGGFEASWIKPEDKPTHEKPAYAMPDFMRGAL